MRRRGIRSSGPSVSSATSLTAGRSSRIRAASMVRPAACLWPPKRRNSGAQRSSAPSMSKRGMLRQDPCATPSVDRQHDRRPVERVHELRRDDADDAAVPALAGDDEHRARADVGIGLDDFLARRRGSRLPLPAGATFSPSSCSGQRARLVAHAPRRWRAAAAWRCRACSCGRRR